MTNITNTAVFKKGSHLFDFSCKFFIKSISPTAIVPNEGTIYRYINTGLKIFEITTPQNMIKQ